MTTGSGRAARLSRGDAAEFQNAVANVAILGEMRGGDSLAHGGYHLIERSAGEKVGVELAAKFAGAARTRVEALQCSLINVFQRELSSFRAFAGREHEDGSPLTHVPKGKAKCTHETVPGTRHFEMFFPTAFFACNLQSFNNQIRCEPDTWFYFCMIGAVRSTHAVTEIP